MNHQPSALEDFCWPISDPFSAPQKSRLLVPDDHQLISHCLPKVSTDIPRMIAGCRSLPEKILAILSHHRFQMNPVSLIRSDTKCLKDIEFFVGQGRPIDIMYPLFCVIPSRPKRYSTYVATAGEECTIRWFGTLNTCVKEVYKPGIIFHILVDAALYASAFGTSQVEVAGYWNSLVNIVQRYGAEDYIDLRDLADVIASDFLSEYQVSYYEWQHKTFSESLSSLFSEHTLVGMRRSVRSSINTRRFPFSHNDDLKLFGPIEYRDTNNPYFSMIENLTDVALKEYICIRFACDEIHLDECLWPHALRASCHKGLKNGKYPIGLRPYPEYFGSCKTLPYHGMPKITCTNDILRLQVLPEVLLRGDTSLERVEINESGQVWAYIESK